MQLNATLAPFGDDPRTVYLQEVVFSVSFVVFLGWVLRHGLRNSRGAFRLGVPLLLGMTAAYLAVSLPQYLTSGEALPLDVDSGPNEFYVLAAQVIPALLVAVVIEGELVARRGRSQTLLPVERVIRSVAIAVLAIGEIAALWAAAASTDSFFAFAVTAQAIAVGFAAIFVLGTSIDSPTGSEILDQIEKLGALRKSGVLSDEEFHTQQARLLSRLS